MIGYLKGKVIENNDGRALIAIGTESSSVGYAVNVPARYQLDLGRVVELYVHTHVREDAFELFGFLNGAEKELFNLFLSVSGIGPKGALGLLSHVDSEALITAVLEGDKDFLVRIPGVGKKTAERIVLELSDTLRKKGKVVVKTEKAVGVFVEARDALLGLGYREQDVSAILSKLKTDKPELARVEDIIRMALQRFSSGVGG
jgi:Holliday junction DNA helicase RuvA